MVMRAVSPVEDFQPFGHVGHSNPSSPQAGGRLEQIGRTHAHAIIFHFIISLLSCKRLRREMLPPSIFDESPCLMSSRPGAE